MNSRKNKLNSKKKLTFKANAKCTLHMKETRKHDKVPYNSLTLITSYFPLQKINF